MSEDNTRFGRALAETVEFDLLGDELGHDLHKALELALQAGAVFPRTGPPVVHLREAIADAISQISSDDRWGLFLRFLEYGPKDVEETVPKPGQLTQAETATVISFVWGHAINSFQGAIAELLATAPCTRILQALQREGSLAEEARLYVGDAVMAARSRGSGRAKGADLHFLVVPEEYSGQPTVRVVGVGEVKSYFCSEKVIRRQLERHLTRAKRGLWVSGRAYSNQAVRVGRGTGREVTQIAVLPGRWPLPRTLRWRQEGRVRIPEVTPGSPPVASDEINRPNDTDWQVSLRWSREALAAAAYDMTFWLMSKIGEVAYQDGVPPEWSEMTPAEAGYNAAKEKLYYAIRPYAVKAEESTMTGNPKLTRKEALEMQRAIALYNSYSFGYVLGMNFRNRAGRREMLWPQDLDEILANGETRNGCRIV